MTDIRFYFYYIFAQINSTLFYSQPMHARIMEKGYNDRKQKEQNMGRQTWEVRK